MNKDLLKKFGKSAFRIVAALAIILGVPAIAYLLWQPGSNEPLPEYANNAIWIGHGWMGDDQRHQGDDPRNCGGYGNDLRPYCGGGDLHCRDHCPQQGAADRHCNNRAVHGGEPQGGCFNFRCDGRDL